MIMNSPATSHQDNGNPMPSAPIIIDLGKISGKKAKQLKKGQGLYVSEVQPAIAQAVAKLGDALAGKEIVPVVVLYKKKPSKGRFPMLNLLS